MALGDPYATLDQAKVRVDIPLDDTNDDDRLTGHLATATADINRWCGRQFNKADTATARRFRPLSRGRCRVDDFYSTDGLVVAVDADGDGVYEQVWSAADYELDPVDGIVEGEPGWPFSALDAVGAYAFPVAENHAYRPLRRRSVVQLTARWGWDAVPKPVHESCLILTEELHKLADTPFAGAEIAVPGVNRVQMNSRVKGLLAKYRRPDGWTR
ncbi:hypothetical protein [Catellatospora sp. NPDC049609]|uniref:hypothetical protein n=1 Tax=Catellatospora sp. NPDC049609 TaxID=3155505 RepID=UPI00341D038E